MSWLATNWDTIMTILNTVGLLIFSKMKVSKKDVVS